MHSGLVGWNGLVSVMGITIDNHNGIGVELPGVLRQINTALKPGGLFYLGVYGGSAHRQCNPYYRTGT